MNRDYVEELYKMHRSFFRWDVLMVSVSALVILFILTLTIWAFRMGSIFGGALDSLVAVLNIWTMHRSWSRLHVDLAKMRESRAMLRGMEASE